MKNLISKIAPTIAPFKLSETYTTEILNLLSSVVLGSNGARYQHQHIERRIKQLYKPLFINLERHEKVLGNITFCRRPTNWYVRYFAFDLNLQANTQQPRSKAKNSTLKKRVDTFFEGVFIEPIKIGEEAPKRFYAYIDPRNERSLWMSQNFGFYTVAKIATQTFSRIKPKKNKDVIVAEDRHFIKDKIHDKYHTCPFYFTEHTFNETPFYTLIKDGEIVAFAKTHRAEWVIERLPGKNGKVLRNIIPFVPGLNKVIRPNSHEFVVIDSVWCVEHNFEYLEQLFEGILFHEKANTMIWWTDQKDPIYRKNKRQINWGLLHNLNGAQEVELVIKTPDNKEKESFDSPTYVTGFDFI